MADDVPSVCVTEDSGHNSSHRRERLMVGRRDMKRIIVMLTATALMCLLFYHWESPFQPQLGGLSAFVSWPMSTNHVTNKNNSYDSNEIGTLEKILSEAATEKKIVILTLLNRAWAEPNSTFHLFLESFHVGNGTKRLLRQLVVMCLDEKAYTLCSEVHPGRCYLLKTPGVDFSGQKNYMTEDYLKMGWRRIEFLGSLLKLGYSFISTDMDIMWLRDPFPRLFSEEDFQVSCDWYNGKPADKRNLVNIGFKFVQANNRTVEFYNYWYGSRWRFHGMKDQDVFNAIKNNDYTEKLGLTIRFLDTLYFRGFCQMSHEMNKVCTMHANCCGGMQEKTADLRQVLEDWREYLSASVTADGSRKTFRSPDNCRGRTKKSKMKKVRDASKD